MARVEVHVKKPGDEDSFMKALQVFKKICKKEGFIREIRDKRYFLTNREKKVLKRKRRRK